MNGQHRLKCDYCGRVVLSMSGDSVRCSACGHGDLRFQKPRTYCSASGKPIFANVDPNREIICGLCAMKMVAGVQDIEKKLHTDFKDTADMEEKLAYYEAKVIDADKARTLPDKVRIKSLGKRLMTVRKKLGWNQKQTSDYFGIKSKSEISRYEKDLRKIPEEIKDWIKEIESVLHHSKEKALEKVTDLSKMGNSPQEKLPKSAELIVG